MYNVVISDNDVIEAAPLDYRLERQRRSEELRRSVLDVAGRLLVEEGPGALTMRRVAQAVNASTQVLYTMFGGKTGLADALYREGFARLTQAHGAVAPATDPIRRLEDRARRYFENAAANPAYYRVMFFDAIPGFRPTPETLAETWGTFDALAEAVRACARDGSISPRFADEPREAAVALWSAVHGVASLHVAGHLPDLAEARRILERTIRAVIRDLAVDRDGPHAITTPPLDDGTE